MGKDVCLGCSKKFTKNDSAIQCTVCGLWIHKQCANMSDEVFDLLDKQKRESGITYWACRPCTTFAQGMNHRLRQIDNDIKELKQTATTNTEAIKNLEHKVAEVKEIAQKNDGMTKEEFESRMKEEKEEAKERKARELNVIIHGLEECSDGALSGEEKMRRDIRKCVEAFSAMELGVEAKDVKFCRRVGAKGETSRPLIVGFYDDKTRNHVLRADWRGMEPEMTAGPDMTKKQREEEAQIWKELETRNNNRTEEEMSKNLKWRMVGQKGERRLILGAARPEVPARGRGAARAARGGQTTRGGQTWRGAAPTRRPYANRGTSRPARARGGPVGTSRLLPTATNKQQPWTPRGEEEEEDDQEVFMDETADTQPDPARTRMGSKRTRDELPDEEGEEETTEPPAKH
jgi:hypothetical protein